MVRFRKLAGGIYFIGYPQLVEMSDPEFEGSDIELELLEAVAHYIDTVPPFACKICHSRMRADDVVFVVMLPGAKGVSWTAHMCARCSLRNDIPRYMEDAARELFPDISLALH